MAPPQQNRNDASGKPLISRGVSFATHDDADTTNRSRRTLDMSPPDHRRRASQSLGLDKAPARPTPSPLNTPSKKPPPVPSKKLRAPGHIGAIVPNSSTGQPTDTKIIDLGPKAVIVVSDESEPGPNLGESRPSLSEDECDTSPAPESREFPFQAGRAATGDLSREKSGQRPSENGSNATVLLQDVPSDFDDPEDDSSSVQIFYRAVCSDWSNSRREIFRYSTTPFEGLQDDPEGENERELRAPFDVITDVRGHFLTQRETQHRQKFGTEFDSDPGPFVFGKDFFARSSTKESIRILSTPVREVLKQLIQYYPNFNFRARELYISAPYKVLVYFWKELWDIANACLSGSLSIEMPIPAVNAIVSIGCDKKTGHHLKRLLEIPALTRFYTETVAPELRLHASGRACYDDLWLLFKPGDIAIGKDRGDLAGFVLMSAEHISVSNDPSKPHPRDNWKITAWNLAYSDRKLKRQSQEFYLYRFYSDKEISSLSIFPVQFMEDNERTRQDLERRGRLYYNIICETICYRRYDGNIIDLKPNPYTGDIIIDHQSYELYANKGRTQSLLGKVGEEPLDLRGEPLWSKFNDMDCNCSNTLTESQYLLLPGHVKGFAVGKKEWAIFDMKYVLDRKEELDPMQHLILDIEEKDLVEAMADEQEAIGVEPWTADFIEGKGQGKVVLLHGGPGTGKTMTVECISKLTKRPLLSLSVADLGTEEVLMEKTLLTWLDRAASWGAIVLIDEAEVYLEARETKDLKRNALVTGMLFLTTNSPGHLDEAVRSRIHIGIAYKQPTDKLRVKIWESLFNKLHSDQKNRPEGTPEIRVEYDAQMYAKNYRSEFPDLKLNGRDLRNALLSAISLAKYNAAKIAKQSRSSMPRVTKAIEVQTDDLRRVLKNKAALVRSYVELYGKSEDQIAIDEFKRAPPNSE